MLSFQLIYLSFVFFSHVFDRYLSLIKAQNDILLTGTFNFQRRKWCAHSQVGSVQSKEKTQIPFCIYQRWWQSAEIWCCNHFLVRLHNKNNSNCKLELSPNEKSDSKVMFDFSKHLSIITFLPRCIGQHRRRALIPVCPQTAKRLPKQQLGPHQQIELMKEWSSQYSS